MKKDLILLIKILQVIIIKEKKYLHKINLLKIIKKVS